MPTARVHVTCRTNNPITPRFNTNASGQGNAYVVPDAVALRIITTKSAGSNAIPATTLMAQLFLGECVNAFATGMQGEGGSVPCFMQSGILCTERLRITASAHPAVRPSYSRPTKASAETCVVPAADCLFQPKSSG